jgi:hypothetical protein
MSPTTKPHSDPINEQTALWQVGPRSHRRFCVCVSRPRTAYSTRTHTAFTNACGHKFFRLFPQISKSPGFSQTFLLSNRRAEPFPPSPRSFREEERNLQNPSARAGAATGATATQRRRAAEKVSLSLPLPRPPSSRVRLLQLRFCFPSRLS